MIAIEQTATVGPNGRLVLERPEFTPGEQVKVIVLIEAPLAPPATVPITAPAGRRLKLDWGGALAPLQEEFTSVELQHKANEWRGD